MSEEFLEIKEDVKNSIEIGETNKGFLYIKSAKRYFGYGTADMEYAIEMLFATYDKAKEAIKSRRINNG